MKFSKMDGSNISLDSIHDLASSNEKNVISLECWFDVPLSEIWIPKNALSNRMKPSESRKTQGIFHTLQKKGHSKCIESFSVYSDSENEDIFLSDSSDSYHSFNKSPTKIKEINTQINSSVSIRGNVLSQDEENNESAECTVNDFIHQNNEKQFFEKFENKNLFKLKSHPSVSNLCDVSEHSANSTNSSFNTLNNKPIQLAENINKNHLDSSNKDCIVDSHNSLHDILDETSEPPMSEFKRDFSLENSYFRLHNEVVDTEKKKNCKKDKKKKKVKKSVTLDVFLDDYTDDRRQEDYCNDYLQKILLEKAKVSGNPLKSIVEFPNLKTESIEYCHGKKSETKNTNLTFKSAANILAESQEITDNATNIDRDILLTTEDNIGSVYKILIENVPPEVSHEDIFSLLSGYGEIKNISLNIDGEFLLASVEISLTSDIDIDWIIDCLNGAEPFGVSSKPLKCHKLP